MKAKSNILIMCYRPFDIRLMVSSGILNRLSVKHNLILLLPQELISILKKDLLGNFFFEKILYYNPKFKNDTNSSKFIFKTIDNLIQKILYFTYGSSKSNITQEFLSNMFLNFCQTPKEIISGYLIVKLSKIASRLKWFRFFLQKLGTFINTPNLHNKVFNKYKPSVLIVWSLGLSLDALIMREAKKKHVKIMSIIQSWDKTSSKGYPVVFPDRVVVWSHIMAEETEFYHDIYREDIMIGGAPQWDYYFENNYKMKRDLFIKKYQLDPNKKIVYFGLCSMAYHEGNLETISYLVECLKNNLFAVSSQIIFRPHPAYYGGLEEEDFAIQYKELMTLINKCLKNPYIRFIPPKITMSETAYISPDDNLALKEILLYSDVCVSVLSTQMIEAAILDKPIVTLEYGIWKTSEMEVELSELKLEHIERVFKTNAISRSKTHRQLIDNINEYLVNPNTRSKERKQLVDQEIPVNRGNAAIEVSKNISDYANLHTK